MDIFLALLGIAVAAFGLNDIFHTLLHPTGRGRLSRWIAAGVWQASKVSAHRGGHVAGPTAMVLVIVAWTLLQTLGWALIYYPYVPEGFHYSPGVDPGRYNAFAEAVYISMVTLSTLGYGDVVAVDGWIRLFSPIQALTGFALLTAALSWFGQIYPALGRRRALAIRIHLLAGNDYASRLDAVGPAAGSRVLEEVASGITQARIDITQNTETYYFRETDARTSLAASLGYAVQLSATAQRSPVAEIRLNGRLLQSALDDFAEYLREQFSLGGGSTAEILAAFAADHGRPAVM
jgi:voltage-gated potassium channel Kch